MNAPTFGSLFAGIGGIDLGLERAGWECRFQVEWDPFCQRVLAKHWPDVPRYGDIHDVHGPLAHADYGYFHKDETLSAGGYKLGIGCSECLPRVDLLAGGFPCQPFSIAGRRAGIDDDRWLWPEFARAIRELRPRFVLVENVPGLLVGGGMGAVLGDLAALGYDAEWESIPAAAVGAPHLRYRVWIVAYANGTIGGSTRTASQALRGPETVERPGRRRSISSDAAPNPERGGCNGRASDQERRQVGRTAVIEASTDARWGDYWLTEPDVGRVAHGVPARVDRLRSLGNAVVPQVVEWIGRRMIEHA